jgi:DNA-binding MarR family transcriptional regulator
MVLKKNMIGKYNSTFQITHEIRGVSSRGVSMTSKGPRKANGGFDLAETPSHLMRRCQQLYGDLYSRESGTSNLTKQQFTVLCALEHNDGASQTALVEMTGIDRSTLADMMRRMLDRGLIIRERTETDMRANAVAIAPAGRKSLRTARAAAGRAEERLLEALPPPERQRFIKALAAIATAGEELVSNGTAPPRRKRAKRRA